MGTETDVYLVMGHLLVLLLLLWSSGLRAEGNHQSTGNREHDVNEGGGAQCESTAKTDIVLLVDHSGNIRPQDFETIRSFVADVVRVFDIGPDRFQFGLTQYSIAPETMWHLNTHQTKQSLLSAIANLRQGEGDTRTGRALDFINQENFKPGMGMRADSRKIAVLITDRKVNIPSQKLKDNGIEIYTIGVKDADKTQLWSIASDPKESHMYNTEELLSLPDIVTKLIIDLCNSTDISGAQCESTAKTDIVLLVDHSGNIRPQDFETIRSFVADVVRVFDIGPDRFQFGLTRYSIAPETMWHLNTHQTKQSLLSAIANLRQGEGDTRTGRALYFINHENFKPSVGMRADSRKIAVLITDRKSHSKVNIASQKLKDNGIEIYTIGVKDADKAALWSIASHPKESHMYHIQEFLSLPDIFNKLTINLCYSTDISDSVRLVDGTSLCSGRLEVKPHQSNQSHQWWSSVCEADFDQQDAEVVCRQLGCGPSSVLQGVLYREVEAPVWTKEFQCGGHESALLDCRSSGSARTTCSPGKAVGLTCSEPVRLVGGASRCAGTLEVNQGEWRPVDGYYWTLKEAAVVCRDLDCGSAVSTRRREQSSRRSVWWIRSECVQSGFTLRECSASDSSSSILELNCSDSVGLVDGTSLCSGRLEVKPHQSNQSHQCWSSVCEADFDQQDAEVVCRQLGCGPPSVLQGVLYGEVEAPVWTKEFQCGGHESALLDCRSSGSARTTCSPGKAVGLTCSEPVRLVGGASRCAGTLEVKQGEWRPVEDNEWTLKVAAVACRELDCGYPVSTRRREESSEGYLWRIRSDCVQSGFTLKECSSSSSRSPFILELTCSELLVQPVISVSSSMDRVSEAQQEGYSRVFRGSNFIINCSVKPQYPGGFFRLTFPFSSTTHNYTQPAVNHSAHFLFPAAEPTHQGSYCCVYRVYVFGHTFSSESRWLRLTVSDPTGPIIRLVVLPLSLLLMITVIYFILKATREQKPGPQETMELDYYNLGVSRAEGGPAEEEGVTAAQSPLAVAIATEVVVWTLRDRIGEREFSEGGNQPVSQGQ
ncbi:uncharacterized protein [Trachinotus anak]|uniref:uncharacterized protein n=1 Tax=Trachinotus anak TaxID=443729 RepID=UPI0039F16CD5